MMVRVRFNNVKFSEFTPREKIVAINDGIMEEYGAIRLDYHCAGKDFFKIVAHESAEGKPGVLDEAIAYYARDDDRVYDILRSILGDGVTICGDEAFCVTGAITMNEQETKEKNEMKEDVMDSDGHVTMNRYRACLDVGEKSPMRIMLIREDAKSLPGNLVPLPGATIEVAGYLEGERLLPESKRMEICQIVCDLCRRGAEAERNDPKMSGCVEHLYYAHSLLDDFKRAEDEIRLSEETRETILSNALWRVEAAMRCMGCNPDADHDNVPSNGLTPGDIAEDVEGKQCRISTR